VYSGICLVAIQLLAPLLVLGFFTLTRALLTADPLWFCASCTSSVATAVDPLSWQYYASILILPLVRYLQWWTLVCTLLTTGYALTFVRREHP
jgi:hypothetical protein